jgi:hypothetical protein
MSVWRDVHAGDIVLGHDGQEWGVLNVEHFRPAAGGYPSYPLTITLTRYGRTIAGQPDPSAPVIITQSADHTIEYAAVQHLLDAGFPVCVVSESIGESA